MSYIHAKNLAKRFKQDRRVSGADILRKELDLGDDMDVSLLTESSDLGRRQASGLSRVVSSEDTGVSKLLRTQMSSTDFEEWIKLATDNKINSTNSWNFALIDYFHEMSLLKEGGNINFQKASATLDGCVKIYSSRVDSVATETGRLLTGLATKKNELAGDDQPEGDGDEDHDTSKVDGEETKKKKLSKARIVDSTLVNFDVIRIKKLDQELEIDPLFKRALSEFDEGGAKSLLLNILDVNSEARVVFDTAGKQSSEDVELEEEVSEQLDTIIEDDEGSESQPDADSKSEKNGNDEVDILGLGAMMFDSVDEILTQEICPSLKSLNIVLEDINKAKSVLGDVNSSKDYYPIGHNASVNNDVSLQSEAKFELGDDIPDLGFDNGADFGLDADNSFGSDNNDNMADIFDEEKKEENEEMELVKVDKDLMAYFDQNMRSNWAGPEHWKVAALKKREIKTVATSEPALPKKPKEVFTIDFMSDLNLDEEYEAEIFKEGTRIDLPKNQQISENNNLLPKDIFFSSERLLMLFTKPDLVRALVQKDGHGVTENNLALENGQQEEPADQNFWANKYEQEEKLRDEQADLPEGDEFFGDDDFGAAPSEEPSDERLSNVGSNLIVGGRKVRPDYVNFSRTAKKVDVKYLKDNLWKSVNIEKKKDQDEKINFKDVVHNISNMYPDEERKDLSTSFCFICMLHLANEHSLSIENTTDYSDLKIIY